MEKTFLELGNIEAHICPSELPQSERLWLDGPGIDVGFLGCQLLAPPHIEPRCFEINREDFHAYQESHKVLDLDNVHYKRLYGWRLANVNRYAVPVRYSHPKGAIVWVDLTKQKCRVG